MKQRPEDKSCLSWFCLCVSYCLINSAAVLPWGPPQFCRSVTMTSTIIILPQSLEENTADLLHKLNLVLEVCQSFLLWYVKQELYIKFYIMLLQMWQELCIVVFLKAGWPTSSYFFIIDLVLISIELIAELWCCINEGNSFSGTA